MKFKMSDDVEPFFHGSMPQLTFQQRTKIYDPSSEYGIQERIHDTTVTTRHTYFHSETLSIHKQRVYESKRVVEVVKDQAFLHL